ncbi:hypothetical protein COU56_04540 [Candidatus Pacearchaeota archaeon CG10_big_fil_rev_8_21_14_0_10_31_9]|nr:MAG: hypothetical protein COU56_04540 [Candidatus Pacearchaeota archaeon CG10_big_fil_rev_8_21_14_0_10_31_9]
MLYQDAEDRKKKVRKFLKENPRATFRDIKRLLHTKIDKVYSGGMEEAFHDAGVNLPRTFKRKTKEENKRVIIEYIKKHPRVGAHTITRDLKVNPSNFFQTMKQAYDLADVEYPRKYLLKPKEQKRKEIILFIQNNPLASSKEIKNHTNINPYKIFKNFDEIYRAANLNKFNHRSKRLIKKQNQVVSFIKNNNFATQRDINLNCKTHVQDLFTEGIFEAYKKANIEFPYERLRLYGVGIEKVRDEARLFEEKIALKLSGYGKVNRLVKIKGGFADIILERKDKKAVIEVKNYKLKEISRSQINQLNKYLEDCNCDLGFLICHTKPKKDNFIMGKNRIFILNKDELSKIPYLMSEL